MRTNFSTVPLQQKLGISRIDFSRKYGIPIRTLEDWDSGRRHPPIWISELLIRIVEIDAQKKEVP